MSEKLPKFPELKETNDFDLDYWQTKREYEEWRDKLVAGLQKRIDDLPAAKFRWESHEQIGYKRAMKDVLESLQH